MLLPLDSMHRVKTLVAINVNDITVFDNSILIPITSLIKQSTVRRHPFTMCLNIFFENPTIVSLRYLVKLFAKNVTFKIL